jgi:hypothetical protein
MTIDGWVTGAAFDEIERNGMRVEDVESHVGELDRPYRVLGHVKATERALGRGAPNPRTRGESGRPIGCRHCRKGWTDDRGTHP